MALVNFTDSPKVTDTILLEITTPDADGCLTSDPYKVDRLVVYFVERDFLGANYGEYTKSVVDPDLQAELEAAQAALCADPSADNVADVARIQNEIESKSQQTTFYYKDRLAVKVVGTSGFPAWLSSDTDNASLTQTGTAAFSYEWNPNGAIREGDYFLCWTWTPNPAGESLSAHVQFSVAGDPAAVSTIPTHLAPDDKYETLLERYLAEMYKRTLTDGDVTPQVLDDFNGAVAKGFTFVENMANQVIDLFDANALHESMLVYLSNLFGLKLKSGDPTLWRRQIKEAVALFKKKGTLSGLQDAFSQAGMVLNAFTQYWQIISPYTWIESFVVKDTATFELYQDDIVLPIDPDNFGLWLKREGESEYQQVPNNYVTFEVGGDGIVRMTWVADNLSNNAVDLFEGDHVKVMYQYNVIPGPTEQQLENYIRSLPLADQRDEDDQTYPLKNWNVRLIAEQDPLFSVLVPTRHPFHEPLIFGWLRTEFAYSENIYNMEEYNGSTRPSLDPCRIDKEFLDPCGACLSSVYSVDIGVEELSNDRMLEAQEILREYVPFHAQVHSLNFTGEVNEFVQSPEEDISVLVSVDYSQFVISGNSNPIFHRVMQDAVLDENYIIDREMLTDQLTVLSGKLGTAYNDHVAFVAPDIDLYSLGVNYNSHVLEVLAPSGNAGTYAITDIDGRTARVGSSVTEPVDETEFTFNLSNLNYGNSYSSITQRDSVLLSDVEVDFAALGVKSLWDVDHTDGYTGGSWKVLIPAYSATPYEINNVTGGVVSLSGDSLLPTSDVTGVSYTLYDDLDNVIDTSTTGSLEVKRRGLVELNDGGIIDIHEFVKRGDLLYYDGNEYEVVEFDDNDFYIEGYEDGDASGVTVQVRRRLAENALGYFGYRGLKLISFSDHESEFGMINGNNQPAEDDQGDDSHFKENFMFLIGGEYYKIAEIDGQYVTLAGRDQNWMTLDAGGTTVSYSIVHFPTKEVSVQFITFDQLNRNGAAPVIREIESAIDSTTAIVALQASPSSGLQEQTTQEEGISFTIQRRNGDVFEGEL